MLWHSYDIEWILLWWLHFVITSKMSQFYVFFTISKESRHSLCLFIYYRLKIDNNILFVFVSS